jgi:hypothetical protein
MVETERIELSNPVCKTGVFPLELRPLDLVPLVRFELTPCLFLRQASLPLEYSGINGDRSWHRTNGLFHVKETLCH